MIVDRYNRVHDYLRISLTDNCNLRCFYCMPDEDYDFTPAGQLMQPAEIEALARVFVANGVTKIRLTGGEPLVRKEAADIIRRLSALPVKLALTTNATRLHEFIELLKDCGITALNVSLDTLNADTFRMLTRRPLFEQVYRNIQSAIDSGFDVKLNVVVMKGLNDGEINDFVAWTKHAPIHIRFIEFMPFTGNKWSSSKVFTLEEILARVGSEYDYVPLQTDIHDTAKQYKVAGHSGDFAIISTMSAPFCSGCNRMRLTADGKMKNCLFSTGETDLLAALRNGEDVEELIMQNILQKSKELGGQFSSDLDSVISESIHNRSMITIGG